MVLWLVWTPLQGVGSRVALGIPTSPPEVVLNLALLGPAALVLAIGARRSIGHRRILIGIALGAAAFSGLIELVQWWWTALGRVASPADVILNTTGAALAAWVGLRLRGRLRPGAVLIAVGAGVFVAVALYQTAAALMAADELHLAGWDPEYDIAAGDEVGGGRAFRGVVSEAEICAGADGERLCAEPGADVSMRRRLVEAAERSRRLGVSAVVRSGAAEQTGPARIVTFSADTLHRNLTLGQEGRDLVLRVRTPGAGPNGSAIVYALPDAIRRGPVTG